MIGDWWLVKAGAQDWSNPAPKRSVLNRSGQFGEANAFGQSNPVVHERISSSAILLSSSVKTNSSSIGLPGKFPVSRLVTIALSSF